MSTWHILDARSIWIKEFAAALSARVPVKSWIPEMRWIGVNQAWVREEVSNDPPLPLTMFPLQRGYSRVPLSALPWEKNILKALRESAQEKDSVLVCTTPYYAPIAEKWQGPVIYYLTDFNAGYPGVNRPLIEDLDRRMVNVASLVCPNSERTGQYLIKRGCKSSKLVVIPNATREKNVPKTPLLEPGPLPQDLADLPRPIVGVLGNLSGNMDWLFLRAAIRGVPSISWAFIGPVDMEIEDPAQRAARAELIHAGGRVRFVGSKPYGMLQEYGRALDVAMMPYVRKEPTFSGSATRFYEHLAACRPILACPGVEELLSKAPLLTLVDSARDAVSQLLRLQALHFRDGYESHRWEASKSGTWEHRADTVLRYASDLGIELPISREPTLVRASA